MMNTVSIAFTAVLLGACAANNSKDTLPVDCSSSLCGCRSEASQPLTLRLADADGSAIASARLICHDNGSFLGKTDRDGVLSLQVTGANTPGCGFMPDCQVAYFRMDDDQFGRHFWFAKFVRGEPVSARSHSVERID